VILDPADELNARGMTKGRTQWRVPGAIHSQRLSPSKDTQLPARLAHLYDEMEAIDVIEGQDDVTSFFHQGLCVSSSSLAL